MVTLKHPDSPTPITVEDERADLYRASGWRDVEPEPAKPKRPRK